METYNNIKLFSLLWLFGLILSIINALKQPNNYKQADIIHLFPLSQMIVRFNITIYMKNTKPKVNLLIL